MATSAVPAEGRAGFTTLIRNRLLLAVTFGHFATDVFANLLPMTYPLLVATLGLNYGMVGLVGTVFIGVASLSQPFFGFMADRVPTRLLAVFGIAWISLLMGTLGFAWDYVSLVAIVSLAGLGNGAFHPQGAMNASMVSGRQRASGVSIFLLGGTIGFAVAPLLAAAIITNFGLRGVLLMTGPALLAAAGVGWAMSGHEVKPRRAEVRPAVGPADPARTAQTGRTSLLAISLLISIVALRSWAYQTLASYTPLLMTEKGYDLTTASRILFIALVGASAGMLGGGLLADKVGRIRTCVLTLAVTAPAMYLFLHTEGVVAIGFLALAGLLVDASHPITVVMAQEMMPRSTGLASGLILGLAFVTGAVGAFLTGVMADHIGLAAAMSISAAFPLVAAGLCLALRRASPQLSVAAD